MKQKKKLEFYCDIVTHLLKHILKFKISIASCSYKSFQTFKDSFFPETMQLSVQLGQDC